MRGAAGNSEGKRNIWYQPGSVLRKGSGRAAAFLGLPVLAWGEKRGCFVLPLGGAVFYGELLRWCWGLGKAAGRSETHWEAFRELLTSDERTPKVTRDHEGWSSPSRFPGMSIFHRNPRPYEDVASGI